MYWYYVGISYRSKDKSSVKIFSTELRIGLIAQFRILHPRSVKNNLHLFLYNNKKTKPLLCNGLITIDSISYLGHFKKKYTDKEIMKMRDRDSRIRLLEYLGYVK